jgi:hypothetical protein
MHRERTDEQKIYQIGPTRDFEYFPRTIRVIIELSDSGSGALVSNLPTTTAKGCPMREELSYTGKMEPSMKMMYAIAHMGRESRDIFTEAVAAKFLELRRKNVSTTLERDRRHAAGNTTLGAPVLEAFAAARTPYTEMVEDRRSLIYAGSLSTIDRAHFAGRFMRKL